MEIGSEKLEVENQKSAIAKKEEEILKFWRDNKIFEQTIYIPNEVRN